MVNPKQNNGQNGLLNYFMNPIGKQPLRLPTYPGIERTSVLAYNVPTTFSQPAAGSFRVGFYPQPALPLWADVTVVGTETFGTWWQFAAPTAGFAGTSAPVRLWAWSIGNSPSMPPLPTITGATGLDIGQPPIAVDPGNSPSLPFVYSHLDSRV